MSNPRIVVRPPLQQSGGGAFFSGAEEGAILYYDGTEWTGFAPSVTPGDLLTSQGPGAPPLWQSAAGGGYLTTSTAWSGDLGGIGSAPSVERVQGVTPGSLGLSVLSAVDTPAEEDLLLFRGGTWTGFTAGDSGTLLGYTGGLLVAQSIASWGIQPLNANLTAISAGTWTGATSITTLGTIGTGTWNGASIGIGYGGTAASNVVNATRNLGAVRTQTVSWYPSAQASGLFGLQSATHAGSFAAAFVNGYFCASASIAGTTSAYGWYNSGLYWYLGGYPFAESTIQLGATANQRVYSACMFISLYSGSRSGIPAGIGFAFDQPAGDSTWQLVTSTGAARGAVDTGVTVTANTWYQLRWELSGTTITWWIWSSASNPTMSGVTPVTGTASPATLPSAQASGIQIGYGQPSSASTLAIRVFQAQVGQLV